MQPELALAELGFTDFESLLYCELLRQGPLTGYRLSQIVAKAPANTYQALKTLAQKGGVVVSDGAGEARTYRPVAPAELMASLGQAFEARREAALDALQGLEAPVSEERVYQFQTASQAIERAHAMLAAAQQIVLFDFFPPIFEMMRDKLAETRARGVTVPGIAYDAAHASQTVPHNPEAGGVISDLWPGLGLIVVVDGMQMLLAQISRDKTALLNGIWSDSAFLSATYHSALAAEIRLTALYRDDCDSLKSIALFHSKPPGLDAVLDRMNAAPANIASFVK